MITRAGQTAIGSGDSDASPSPSTEAGFEHGIKEFYLELEDGANYTVGVHRVHIGIAGVPTEHSDWGGFIQFVDYGQIVFEGSSDNEIRVARFGGSKGSVEVQYLVQGPQTFSGALAGVMVIWSPNIFRLMA